MYNFDEPVTVNFPRHDLELASLYHVDVPLLCRTALSDKIARILTAKPECPSCGKPGYYTRKDGTSRCYKCGHSSDKAMLDTFRSLVSQRG